MSAIEKKYGVKKIRIVWALAKKGVALYRINEKVFGAERRGANAREILRAVRRSKTAVR